MPSVTLSWSGVVSNTWTETGGTLPSLLTDSSTSTFIRAGVPAKIAKVSLSAGPASADRIQVVQLDTNREFDFDTGVIKVVYELHVGGALVASTDDYFLIPFSYTPQVIAFYNLNIPGTIWRGSTREIWIVSSILI